MKPIYERWIYIILSLLVAIGICIFNFTLIPPFDIGLNSAFIVLSCIGVTLLLSIVEIIVLWKFTSRPRVYSQGCWFTMGIYWVVIWGWCYWKCVLEANRLYEQFLQGDI